MISLPIVLTLLFLHFIADFVFQSETMAINKSSSNKWLLIHVGIYSTVFVLFGFLFVLITFILHFITDYFTSRLTTKLWKKGDRHNFFVVIGLDQFIHMVSLILTYYILN